MGKPKVEFYLLARPVGIAPESWTGERFWQFEHAYNPSRLPCGSYYWESTRLVYRWERISVLGEPGYTGAPFVEAQQVRLAAERLLSRFAPYPFEFQVNWNHGGCICSREYNEDCPVHHIDWDSVEEGEEAFAKRITEPPAGAGF
jgi:hypothetical protein